jgi:hypothetical protein
MQRDQRGEICRENHTRVDRWMEKRRRVQLVLHSIGVDKCGVPPSVCRGRNNGWRRRRRYRNWLGYGRGRHWIFFHSAPREEAQVVQQRALFDRYARNPAPFQVPGPKRSLSLLEVGFLLNDGRLYFRRGGHFGELCEQVASFIDHGRADAASR